jgi:hypothetical protein
MVINKEKFMTELKTKMSKKNVLDFINSVSDEKKRRDSLALVDMMKKITKDEPKMWGGSIIGFGSCHLKYESGRELDWFLTGFSPRKQNFSVYIMGSLDKYGELLKKLGKHKTAKSCLYFKSLDDIEIKVLNELLVKSVKDMELLK